MDFCREMGWSYEEYLRTPARVIVRWRGFMNAHRRGQNRRADIEKQLQAARSGR